MLRRLTRMYQRGPAETNRVEPPYISILCSCSDRRGKEACSLWHATHTTSATPMLSKVAGHVSSSMVPLHCLHNTARVGTNCSITGSGIWYEIRRAVVHSFQVWCSLAADTQNYLPGTYVRVISDIPTCKILMIVYERQRYTSCLPKIPVPGGLLRTH